MMKYHLAEIQKVVPPSGYSTRVRPGANRNPLQGGWQGCTGKKFANGCRTQSAGRRLLASQFRKSSAEVRSSGEDPLFPYEVEEDQVCWNGRGQSFVLRRTSDRSRTPDRAQTPVRHQTPDWEATLDKGKAHVTQALLSSPPDCQMVGSFPPPSSRGPPPRIRGLPRSRAVKIRNNAPDAITPQFKASKSEHSFRNTRVGRSKGLGGWDCPFSEHAAGTHTIVKGVAGRWLIRRQRPRQPFEGGSSSR